MPAGATHAVAQAATAVWTLDRQIALTAALAEAFSGFSALVTAAVAVFVLLEAKSIREMEWLTRATQGWQDFNRLILENGLDRRWRRIIDGRVRWRDISRRDLLLIYAYLNVMVVEFNAQKRRLLRKDYVDKSVGENICYFKAIWPDLLAHLQVDGWPSDFLAAADAHVRKRLG